MDIDPRGKPLAREVLDKPESDKFDSETSFRLSDSSDSSDSVSRINRINRTSLIIGNYPEYLSRLSKTDKLKAHYSDNPLTDKEAAALIYGTEEDWKKVADLRIKLAEVTKLGEDSNGRATFGLTTEGKAEVMRSFNNYLLELQRAQDQAEEKNRAVDILKRWKEYLSTDLEGGSFLHRASAAKETLGSRTFCLEWSELIRLQPELAEAVEEDVQQQISNLQAILKGETNQQWTITIHGFDDRSKIAKIRAGDYGRLMNLHCEVASIGELYDRSTMRRYECPLCANIIPILLSLEQKKASEPSRCPCGRKGKFRLIGEDVVTAQAITLQEITELLQPGEQPRRLPAILLSSLAEENAERFNIGNTLTVTGCYIREREDGKATYQRVFLIFGASPVDDAIISATASQEVLAEVERLRKCKDPVKELADLAYARVVGNDLAKQFAVIQWTGDIHLLFLGIPGTGKTEMGKGTVAALPRADFIQASNASRAGLTAAASKDEHTGRYVIESNALVRLNPHGVAVIDELDKAREDVQYSLLGVMQDRYLKINKTNVQANLPCNVNILATANPRGDMFTGHETLWEQSTLIRPLYDRFSFVVLFNNNLSKVDSFREFFKRRVLKVNPLSMHNRLIIRELVKQAWLVRPRVVEDDVTLDRLETLMREVIVPNPFLFGNSLRATEVLPALLEALCRITGDEIPNEWHFQKVTDLLRSLKTHNMAALKVDA